MKRLSYILFFINCSLLTVNCFSQQPLQQWASRYQRTANSPALKNYLALDKLGNSYVCGTVFNTVTRNDIVVIKYNSNGDTVWTRRYNNNNNEDFPAGLVSDSLGNVYVTASSGPGGNLNVMLTIKYSPDGVLLWTRSYGFSGMNVGVNDMKMNKAGNNIYLTGTNSSLASAVTICYNSNGDSLWVRTKQLAGYHYYGQNIAVDNNNNAYAALIRENNSSNLDDFLVVRYDANGNEIWTTIHVNNTGFDAIVGLAIDNAGNSFIAGRQTNSKYLTVMFNPSGSEQWSRIYSNGSGDISNAIATDNNGNCYVTGASSVGGSNYDFLTIKYNINGDSIWVRRYNGPGNDGDGAHAIIIDDSANVYITGGSVGNGTGYDYTTIKYNTSGIQQWLTRYNSNPPGNGDDMSSAILIDNQRNIYVTGTSDRGGFNWDYVTLKYSQPPTAITPISNNIPSSYELYQNYPNPFNPATNIKFQIAKNSYMQLVVFDILGNEVKRLIDGNQKRGIYEVNWNAVDNSSGIYFYKLITENYTETKKMILIK